MDQQELEHSRRACIEHMLRVCKQLAQKYLELKASEYFPNFAVAPANETRLAKFSSLTFDDSLWTEQIRMRYDSIDLLNEVQHFMSDVCFVLICCYFMFCFGLFVFCKKLGLTCENVKKK